VPLANPVIVVLAPVPVDVVPLGLRVNVQLPVVGKPLNTTLPVTTVQVGCVTAPTEGAVGKPVTALKTTLAETEEVQPSALVTVKVCEPNGMLVRVVVTPVPVVVAPLGLRVNVHVPVAGKPLRTTLPEGARQVACMTVPIEGTVGVVGAALMTIFMEGDDVQPAELVTVKVYVPAAKLENVVLTPVPVVVTLSGLRVNVHVPVAGKPMSVRLFDVVEQVGCVSVPTEGAVGAPDATLTVTLREAADIQPSALVTV
jgi:hypothetical protein